MWGDFFLCNSLYVFMLLLWKTLEKEIWRHLNADTFFKKMQVLLSACTNLSQNCSKIKGQSKVCGKKIENTVMEREICSKT